MTARGCDTCHGTKNIRGAGGEITRIPAHRRDCPQMSFPSGRRRDDPGPMPPLRKLDPSRKLPLYAESPLSREMAQIFGGLTEAMLKRHLASQRALQEAAT